MLKSSFYKVHQGTRLLSTKAPTSSIKKTIHFKNFTQNIKFLNNTLVPLIKELDYHFPVITINVNEMNLELTTHDAGNTITSKDTEFIERLDEKINEIKLLSTKK